MTKFIWVAVALLVAVLGGWIWGASGRWSIEREQQRSELRQELLEGRGQVLDARLALYNVNFGEASRHLEDSRSLLGRAGERLKSLGWDGEVTQVEAALARVDEAQRMAGKLDQSANARAGEAAKLLADLLDAEARR